MHSYEHEYPCAVRAHRARTAVVAIISWGVLASGIAFAQAAPAGPPPVWAGSFGAGLALTSGNADTSTVNLAVAVTHDPANPHVIKADALYLRGENEGDVIVNRSTFGVRDDYQLTERTSLYGQFRYLRDTFKQIDYLISPTVGVGQKLIITPRTLLAVDAGIGAVFEKNPTFDVSKCGAVTAGQTFAHKLSDTATVTQSVSGLWKTSDFGDALYTFAAGLAANITTRTTLKIELLEIYKSKPPVASVQKQDVALIASLVYAF